MEYNEERLLSEAERHTVIASLVGVKKALTMLIRILNEQEPASPPTTGRVKLHLDAVTRRIEFLLKEHVMKEGTMAKALDELVNEAMRLADSPSTEGSRLARVTRAADVVRAAFKLGRRKDGELARKIVSAIYPTIDDASGKLVYNVKKLEPGDCQRILFNIAHALPSDVWDHPFIEDEW